METVSQQADIGESVLKMVTVITESKADIDSGTKVGIRDGEKYRYHDPNSLPFWSWNAFTLGNVIYKMIMCEMSDLTLHFKINI